MPTMDGISVIREAQRLRPNLPAILLTGFAGGTSGIPLDGHNPGAFTLLRKPIKTSELSEQIEMLLAGGAASNKNMTAP